MRIKSKIELDFGELNNFYYELLVNEDFNFKTKDIKINIFRIDSGNVIIEFNVDSVVDLKIASNALIKSLEIINKTNNLI